MPTLDELRTAIESAAAAAGPSVVGLGRGWGVGSGIVIAEGAVLTNAHNLRGDDVSVTFHDGRRADGRLAGADPDADLAVVAVETGDTPPIAWSDPGDATLGTPVFAISNPGGRGLRATLGFVSSSGRTVRSRGGRRAGPALEHTAPLVRRSSGSALVNADGRLVGVNTARLDGGFVLALAATAELRERAERLARGESPARARLGIALAPPRAARRMRRAVGLPELDGLLVRAVEPDTPADRAGIERGDLLVAVGGKPLDGVDVLFDALDAAGDGDELELAVVRGADELEVSVSIERG